jgi:glycosyltransferase involved in cell wall biosynthesis
MFDVIVPVKCTPLNLLKKSLQSVKNQTMEDWKCYIIDATPEDWIRWPAYQSMMEEMLKDNRFIWVRKDLGIAEARNEAIEISNSPLVAFLDSDDEWMPQHLQVMMDGLKDNDICITEISRTIPSRDLVDLRRIGIDDEVGIKLDITEVFQRYELANFLPQEYQGYFWYGAAVWLSGLTCRREVVQTIGFDSELSIAEDTDILLRWVAAGWYPVHLPVRTVHRNLHSEQVTQNVDAKDLKDCLDIWEARHNQWKVTDEVLESMQPEHRAIMKHLNNNAKVRYVFMESMNLDIVTKEDYEIELM